VVIYNQVVKALNSNFSERKAMALLYKLEQTTIQLVKIQQKVIELIKEFKEKFLPDFRWFWRYDLICKSYDLM